MRLNLPVMAPMLALAGSLWIGPATTAAVAFSPADTSPAVKSNPQKAAEDRSAGRVLSDVTLTAKVKNALMVDKAVSASEINVDTVNGVVHLRGNVDSKAEAQRAVRLARKVEGVKGVKNHLQIVPNEGTQGSRKGKADGDSSASGRSMERALSDVTITGKVKSALIQDKNVGAGTINVDTMKGVVHLKGTVPNKAEAQRAVALARKVEGVKGVKSHLQIRPEAKTAGYREQKGAGGTTGRK